MNDYGKNTSTASDEYHRQSVENYLQSPEGKAELSFLNRGPFHPVNLTPHTKPAPFEGRVPNPNYWNEWRAYRLNHNAPEPKPFL